MKLAKKITAVCASLAMAAAMTVTAFAAPANWEGVVATAKACGVQDHNVQQLSNFLEKNQDKFTSEQYGEMCKAIEDTFNNIVTKYLPEGKQAADLTTDERTSLMHSMEAADKEAVLKALVDTGAKYGVKITTEKRATGDGYDVIVEFNGEKTPIDDNKPADTGDVVSSNNAAAFAAAAAMLLAGTGIVVVAKKNREN